MRCFGQTLKSCQEPRIRDVVGVERNDRGHKVPPNPVAHLEAAFSASPSWKGDQEWEALQAY